VSPSTQRRRLTAAERRADLLRAAREVFAVRGYHGASIDDIAGAAGVSKALIYEHFAGKKDLHASLLAEEAGELFGRLGRAAAEGEDDEARLRAGIDAFLGFVEERRDAFRALLRDAADPELGDVFDRLQGQATAVIASLMRPEPDSDPTEVAMLAQQLSGAVQALASWWHDHREVPREQVLDAAMAFAWTGLERLRAPS
jgi:AcrR family transcriptional regulator